MSRHPVGRHRAPRWSALHSLRRPAAAATVAISVVSLTAAGYATASGAAAVGAPAPGESAGLAAAGAGGAAVLVDASTQLLADNAAVPARTAARGQDMAQNARAAASADALRRKADAAASAKRAAAARAQAAAATKARAGRSAGQATSRSAARPPVRAVGGSPQSIAAGMLASFGWGQGQLGCLTSLWTKESGWNSSATNPGSGAYGIPQALPGSKMASAGADWRTNPATQIRWGLGYIRSVYGSPCAAWGHSQATNWY